MLILCVNNVLISDNIFTLSFSTFFIFANSYILFINIGLTRPYEPMRVLLSNHIGQNTITKSLVLSFYSKKDSIPNASSIKKLKIRRGEKKMMLF